MNSKERVLNKLAKERLESKGWKENKILERAVELALDEGFKAALRCTKWRITR